MQKEAQSLFFYVVYIIILALMPELHNIQTFVKLSNENTFNTVVTEFVEVLKIIGINSEKLYNLLNSYEWLVEDNGFVYPTQPYYNKTKFSDLEVQPLIIGYTPGVDNSFKDKWISLELLFRTENIWDTALNSYKPEIFELIKNLSLELQKQFKDTGVYFTDESQDGNDFDGLRKQDHSLLWQFDYAVIPNHLKRLYSSNPEDFLITEHEEYAEVINSKKWSSIN